MDKQPLTHENATMNKLFQTASQARQPFDLSLSAKDIESLQIWLFLLTQEEREEIYIVTDEAFQEELIHWDGQSKDLSHATIHIMCDIVTDKLSEIFTETPTAILACLVNQFALDLLQMNQHTEPPTPQP